MRERWKEVLEKVGELYRQLSRAQKVSLFVLSGALALSLILFSRVEGDASYHASLSPGGEEARTLSQKARSLATGEAPASSGANIVSWLYEGSGWLDPPEKFEAKLLDSRCRLIEESIRWNKRVEHAVIAVHRGPQQLLARQSSQNDSAAVVLRLKEGCDRLPRRDARAIRSVIQGAFSLLPENIALTDSNLNAYDSSPVPYARDDEEDSLGRRIEDDVINNLRTAYAEHEYAVSVNVQLSGRSSSIEKKEYDKRKTFNKPTVTEREGEDTRDGGGTFTPATFQEQPRYTYLKEKTEERSFPSLETSITQVPAGEVLGVRMNVLLDIDAVHRLIGWEDISKYERQQELFLKNLVAYDNTEVTVLAQPFTRPPPAPPPQIADPPPAEPEDCSWLPAGWVSDWWKSLLGGGALLIATAFLALLARRRNRWGKRATERTADLGLPADFAAPRPEHGAHPGREPLPARLASALPEGILRNVDELSYSVRERPEAAASVVRLWLAQDVDAKEEPAQ